LYRGVYIEKFPHIHLGEVEIAADIMFSWGKIRRERKRKI
jgi:hypothetical protein